MNEDRWGRSEHAGRLADHLCEVLPPELVVLIAAELPGHAWNELTELPEVERVTQALEVVRRFALGLGAAPTWEDAAREASAEEPWPSNRVLAGWLKLTCLRPAALREVIEHVGLALGGPEAGAYLAEVLRQLVPWVALTQLRFEAVGAGRYLTVDLICELREGRLLGCRLRERPR